jgi:DNA polymerase-3 subunit chi
VVEYGFYHLTRTPLEPALGRLLERVLASGQRAVVVASSPERVEALDRALWSFGRESFLPHGSREDGFAEEQPVFLTDREDYPNGAGVLVLVDGAEVEPAPQFKRCLYLFDGNEEAAVAQARALWRERRERGDALTYWQQTERGWHKAMATADGAVEAVVPDAGST